MEGTLQLIDLNVIARPPGWMKDSACIEFPNVQFFVERGHDPKPAKAVCQRCLVQRQCLAYALDQEITDGIYGGASPGERKALARAGVTGELVRRFGHQVDAGREAVKDRAAQRDLFDLLDRLLAS